MTVSPTATDNPPPCARAAKMRYDPAGVAACILPFNWPLVRHRCQAPLGHTDRKALGVIGVTPCLFPCFAAEHVTLPCNLAGRSTSY